MKSAGVLFLFREIKQTIQCIYRQIWNEKDRTVESWQLYRMDIYKMKHRIYCDNDIANSTHSARYRAACQLDSHIFWVYRFNCAAHTYTRPIPSESIRCAMTPLPSQLRQLFIYFIVLLSVFISTECMNDMSLCACVCDMKCVFSLGGFLPFFFIFGN